MVRVGRDCGQLDVVVVDEELHMVVELQPARRVW